MQTHGAAAAAIDIGRAVWEWRTNKCCVYDNNCDNIFIGGNNLRQSSKRESNQNAMMWEQKKNARIFLLLFWPK